MLDFRLLSAYATACYVSLQVAQEPGQRLPVPAPHMGCPDPSRVMALSVLGGLHPDYQVAP
ncbi:MAG: hypothetical protein JW940_26540 [Polyangiaceae bacterium]|nr:hypothetical protein [Polyangiaceae bacterium]